MKDSLHLLWTLYAWAETRLILCLLRLSSLCYSRVIIKDLETLKPAHSTKSNINHIDLDKSYQSKINITEFAIVYQRINAQIIVWPTPT